MPKPASVGLLSRAVELRLLGASWEKIGRVLHRHPETCRRWMRRYPAEWNRLYRRQECLLIADASVEGLLILRQLLRSESETIRRDAAKALLDLRMKTLRPTARNRPKTGGNSTSDPLALFLENDPHAWRLLSEPTDNPDDPATAGTTEPGDPRT